MKLTLRKSECLDDWYVIERSEHDGRTWFEQVEGGVSSVMKSARISDADVEGTAEEMLEIAAAIEQRGVKSFKRCAVDARHPEVEFLSPRNSLKPGRASLADADELATEIRRVLGEYSSAKEAK